HRRDVRGWHVIVAEQVARHVMSARRAHRVVQTKALQLDDTPGGHPLATHVIAVYAGFLQDQDCLAAARKHRRQRRATDTAADDNDVDLLSHPTFTAGVDST